MMKLLRSSRGVPIFSSSSWPLVPIATSIFRHRPLSSSGSCSGRSVVDIASGDGELRVFVVAGEVSGDTIGSRLMAAIKRFSPLPVRFAGVGGSLMHQEGLRSLFPMEDIAVMGIWELVPHLNKIRKKLKETTSSAFCFLPHVVVTIDAKGFSFHFLKQLRAKYTLQGGNSPVHVHYVAPSFWAWKGGEARLRGLSRFVDHVLCILPFEEEVCRENGLAATFVGHPILEDVCNYNMGSNLMADKIMLEGCADRFRYKHGLDSGSTIITLLPGSRIQEVTRMLPIFLDTMELLNTSFSKLNAAILVACNHDVEAYIDKIVQKATVSTTLIPGTSVGDKYDAFNASRAALCTSGTATLELQLARLPCLIAYRAHFLTEWLIKRRTKLRFMSLPNILLDTCVIPEALFDACTPENLSRLLKKVVCNVDIRKKQIDAAEKALRFLRPPINMACFLSNESGFFSANHGPSFVAASTILYVAKAK